MPSIWKAFPALDDKLKELVADTRGLSCSQIAEEMSACFGFTITRNSCGSRAGRLGLKLPQSVPELTPEQKLQRERRRQEGRAKSRGNKFALHLVHAAQERSPPTLIEPTASDKAIPHSQRKTIMELNSTTCRWPIGEGVDTFYCGAMPMPNYSYCWGHCCRAYQNFGTGPMLQAAE